MSEVITVDPVRFMNILGIRYKIPDTSEYMTEHPYKYY